MHCRYCGSEDLRPTTIKPPRQHNGPCTQACSEHGRLCLNCRMFQSGGDLTLQEFLE